MKSIYRYIFPVLTTIIVLTSCTKEPTPGQTDQTPASPAAEGTRVIAVSFGPQTKTALGSDGLTPNFTKDDKILLITVPETQGAKVDTQTVAVSVDPKTGDATVTTKLSGNLKALYPAHMAIEGKGGFNILVPAEQSGKFADANICSATIEENATNVQFENKYALFIITPPEGTKSLTIKSLKGIGENGQRSGTQFTISNANTLDGEGCTITIPNVPLDKDGKYYVAVCGNARLSDLSFEAWSNNDGTTGSIKGIPMSVIERAASDLKLDDVDEYNSVDRNTVYEINGNNWHDYVTVANRKWATMNIGASKPEDAGEYFMWGGTTGYVYPGPYEEWYSYPTPPDSVLLENGFCWSNCHYTEGVYSEDNKSVFTKYTGDKSEYALSGIADGKSTLDLNDDAANVKWGGAWRIPTITEWETLESLLIGDFENGFHFGTSSNSIFLPAVGIGMENRIVCGDDGSVFLSSSLSSDESSKFNSFAIFDKTAGDGYEDIMKIPYARCNGCSIRAIVDEPVAENQEDAPQD